MKSRNFLIPDGIEYYIGADAIKFDKLKSNILKIFSKYGCTYIAVSYTHLTLPTKA